MARSFLGTRRQGGLKSVGEVTTRKRRPCQAPWIACYSRSGCAAKNQFPTSPRATWNILTAGRGQPHTRGGAVTTAPRALLRWSADPAPAQGVAHALDELRDVHHP